MHRDLDELQRIWDLKQAGAITADEYERLKFEILGAAPAEQMEPEATEEPPLQPDAANLESGRSPRSTGWIVFGVAAIVFLLIVAVSVSGSSDRSSANSSGARENIVAADEKLVAADMNATATPAPREAPREQPAAASPTVEEDDVQTPAPPPKVAISASLPDFDTDEYCRKIGDTAGGSYEIEATCRDEEAAALSQLRSLDIPDRTLKYCSDIGETAGGSYTIMKTCVEQEANAASRL